MHNTAHIVPAAWRSGQDWEQSFLFPAWFPACKCIPAIKRVLRRGGGVIQVKRRAQRR